MKRILLVDDDMTFRQLLAEALNKQFQTFEADGVQEAIKLLETTTVDAICSDFNMRDGTGMDLLKTLRQQDTRTPFMIMSASDDSRLENEARSWGALFCCKTDFDFLEKIKEICG